MIDLATVFLNQSADYEFIADCLKRIPFDSPHDWRADTLAKIRSGELTAAEIVQGGERRGVIVFAVYELSGVREFFVNCWFARMQDAFPEIAPAVDAMAKAQNCTEIRFNTSRPGMVRAASEYGYKISEVILRKKVQSWE